ncbi:hypothetical protein J1N35_025055 [Gossypium stocksii]|uniref:DUF4283 domain-containing protein n=1 Tax=Gossypium stocksii TaxID=47602 RepID=A0A9D3V5U5_9ROSI|nr:hypothetical protein J1N35_025055 [Gossypium stocksii]
MEDSIAVLLLDDEEEEIIQLEVKETNQEISYVNCLVGVFLTFSVVHFQAMRSTLASVWHPIGGFNIRSGKERYLFRFYYEVDVERNLLLTSWEILSGNFVRRLRTVNHLRHMLRDINPTVVFLIKTKLKGYRMEKARRKCGFPNGIDVDSDGRSEGLSLGWTNDCKITLRSFSRRDIDVIIEEDLEGKTWRCTRFYGAPEENIREAS